MQMIPNYALYNQSFVAKLVLCHWHMTIQRMMIIPIPAR